MSVFGQSDAKIPMFITGIKNQTLELHTSCVKRPTDVGVVVSVVFDNDLRDISRQPRPTDVRLQFIEGYMDGWKRKGDGQPVIIVNRESENGIRTDASGDYVRIR